MYVIVIVMLRQIVINFLVSFVLDEVDLVV